MVDSDVLDIINNWLQKITDREKRKVLFILQDMIYNDLKYTRSPDVINKIHKFLESGNQDSEELKKIRGFINL